jgi:cell wall-associated NlpC family hydrolase
MLKPEQVEAFLSEAKTWEGTPYLAHARIKGGGTDCVQFVASAAVSSGVVDAVSIRNDYSTVVPEGSEYVDRILQYCDEITEAEVTPGAICLFRTSHGWMHSAIVISWPNAVMHATEKRGVIITHGNEDFLRGKPVRFFSIKG